MPTNIRPELAELIPALTAAGLNVYAYVPTHPRSDLGWLVVERDGNTGTVEYDRINGYTVAACIHPSREYGSGVRVDILNYDIPAACLAATQPTIRVRFFKTNPIVPNHGMRHFDWCTLERIN